MVKDVIAATIIGGVMLSGISLLVTGKDSDHRKPVKPTIHIGENDPVETDIVGEWVLYGNYQGEAAELYYEGENLDKVQYWKLPKPTRVLIEGHEWPTTYFKLDY